MKYIEYYRYGTTKLQLVEAPSEILSRNSLSNQGVVINNGITMIDWDSVLKAKKPFRKPLKLRYAYYEHAHEIRYWSIEQADKIRNEPDISELGRDQRSEYIIYKKFCKERGMTEDSLEEFTCEGFAISL